MKPIDKEPFGVVDGETVYLYRLRNERGMRAEITNYGATLVSLKVPDRVGRRGDVVLGYDSIAAYAENSPFLGCTVGRFANRIAGVPARFFRGSRVSGALSA